MFAIQYRANGGVEQLKLEDVLAPAPPGDNEVLVRVRAVALNGFDPMMLGATTGLKTPMPMIPCGDLAGEIVALGAQVQGLAPGQRVTAYPILPEVGMMGETALGAARELLVLPDSVVIPIPDEVSFVQAAALPVAYGTALRMMGVRGAVTKGEKVLILGASGGVGVACIQLAKQKGAYTIAVASGADKCERVAAIGADEVIDSTKGAWKDAVIARHGKPAFYGVSGGVDVVVNYVGGDTWRDTLRVTKNGGRILVCGASAGHDPAEDLRYVWSFEQSIVGSNGWTPDDQRTLLAMVAAGELEPVIDSVRPLGELPQAMAALMERRVVGKAVITL